MHFILSSGSQVHKILALIAYAQMPLINAHDEISSDFRGLNWV